VFECIVPSIPRALRLGGTATRWASWEDDTFVVTTVGFRGDVWLDVNGSPPASSGNLVERFTRLNFGTLQIDVPSSIRTRIRNYLRSA
jgi:hypothetical protein